MEKLVELKNRLIRYVKQNKKQAFIRGVVLGIAFIILVVYGSLFIVMRKGRVKTVERDEVSEEVLLSENVPILKQDQMKEHVFNVLLIGVDSRGNNDSDGRSDAMMLVSFNELEGRATSVSFMRDSLVEVPGYGLTKLGHSYAYGGVGLTINTLNQTYDLDIQHYVTINFESLVHVIDKVGGVEVPITEEEAQYYRTTFGKSYIREGVNVLNGKDALMHARNRSLGDDFGRTRRQRSVINGIYRKIMENKNPADLIPIIDYCLKQVKTNMDISLIYEMAEKVFGIENLTVMQTSIPAQGTYTDETYENMAVLKVDIEENKKILSEFLY